MTPVSATSVARPVTDAEGPKSVASPASPSVSAKAALVPSDTFDSSPANAAQVIQAASPSLSVGATPLVRVRLQGSAADLLLPVGERGAAHAFEDYLNRLQHKQIFPDAEAVIAALRCLPVEVSEPVPAGAPLVAIVSSTLQHLVPDVDTHESKVTRLVANLVRDAGCHPVVIPPCADVMLPERKVARARGIVDMARVFDGVVGLGGDDVHPRIYGETNRFAIDPIYPRDRFEADFALAAMDQELFMLGICRSHQLWNAATHDRSRHDSHGRPRGSLVQDVQKEGYSTYTQNQAEIGLDEGAPHVYRDPATGRVLFRNRVVLDHDSQLAEVVDHRSSLLTNSFHHQAVKAPGMGLAVLGKVRDPVTGRYTIEATGRWNVLTLQFHPELAASHSAVDRQIFSVVTRRAKIFSLLKTLRETGTGTVSRLVAAMTAQPPDTFHSSDFAWVRTDLARHAHLRP